MSDTSAIEWTDATWNPVRGCTKVSPGCAHCYAETFAERWRGVKGHPYEQGFDLRLVPEKLTEPLHWKKPRRVFVNSMSDLFQDGVPDAFIDRVFAVMALTPQHTYQVLTKRADLMREYVSHAERWVAVHRIESEIAQHYYDRLWADGVSLPAGMAITVGTAWPLPNVWLGVSIENQHFAEERIPSLLQTPAAMRFVSAEPLLGPVDLAAVRAPEQGDEDMYFLDSLSGGYYERETSFDTKHGVDGPEVSTLDWVIVGGESGPGARPFDVAWARSIVRQCKAAGVPCFVKQFGANAYLSPEHDGGTGYVLSLRSRKGGDPSEWPEDLRVRQFPV